MREFVQFRCRRGTELRYDAGLFVRDLVFRDAKTIRQLGDRGWLDIQGRPAAAGAEHHPLELAMGIGADGQPVAAIAHHVSAFAQHVTVLAGELLQALDNGALGRAYFATGVG